VTARTLRVATRGSPLARWQAEHVASLVRAHHPEIAVDLVVVETQGDRRLDVPIWELGGKGVFAKEVQAAVLDGRADLAVHSAKDLPSVSPPGLVIAAVPERGDPRDALVGSTLAALPDGAEVATGSLRRQVALLQHRPDLRFVSLRGNMQTRLDRAVAHDAAVLAAIALDRLGLADHIAERLPTETVLPQVGQGALAAECREADDELRDLLAPIEHLASRRCVDAERAFLAELGGDCSLPAAAHAIVDAGDLLLTAFLASPDGHTMLRTSVAGSTRDIGAEAARQLLDAGGAALVASS
jgi:hydroxymethylbilane synthase